MTPAPFVVSFVGASGAGKTTLIEQLIPRLHAAGLSVGTVKHAPHGYQIVDKPGSDSSRHRAAGADLVLLAGASGSVLFVAPDTDQVTPAGQHHGPTHDGNQISRLGELVRSHLVHVDIVLAEGFAPIHDALVIVQRSGLAPKDAPSSTPVWFRVTDEPSGTDLAFDQVDAIAARLLSRVAHPPLTEG